MSAKHSDGSAHTSNHSVSGLLVIWVRGVISEARNVPLTQNPSIEIKAADTLDLFSHSFSLSNLALITKNYLSVLVKKSNNLV